MGFGIFRSRKTIINNEHSRLYKFDMNISDERNPTKEIFSVKHRFHSSDWKIFRLDLSPKSLPSRPNQLNKTPTQSPLTPIRLNFNFPSPPPPSAHLIAFRSKRGSISFDNPITPLQYPTSPTAKISPTNKPRLKFSMLRDSTTSSSFGSTSPNYSMTLANDLNLDEKTNRMINEYLRQDQHEEHRIPPPTYEQPITVSSPSIIVTGYDSST